MLHIVWREGVSVIKNSGIRYVIVVSGQFRLSTKALESLRSKIVRPILRSGGVLTVLIHGWTSDEYPVKDPEVIKQFLGSQVSLEMLLEPELDQSSPVLQESPLTRVHNADRFRYASQWESLSRAWSLSKPLDTEKIVVIRLRLDSLFFSTQSINRLISQVKVRSQDGQFAFFPQTEGHSSLPIAPDLLSDQFLVSDGRTFEGYVGIFEFLRSDRPMIQMNHSCSAACQTDSIEASLRILWQSCSDLPEPIVQSIPFVLNKLSKRVDLMLLKCVEVVSGRHYPAVRSVIQSLFRFFFITAKS